MAKALEPFLNVRCARSRRTRTLASAPPRDEPLAPGARLAARSADAQSVDVINGIIRSDPLCFRTQRPILDPFARNDFFSHGRPHVVDLGMYPDRSCRQYALLCVYNSHAPDKHTDAQLQTSKSVVNAAVCRLPVRDTEIPTMSQRGGCAEGQTSWVVLRLSDATRHRSACESSSPGRSGTRSRSCGREQTRQPVTQV
jgi:hypothetical protein